MPVDQSNHENARHALRARAAELLNMANKIEATAKAVVDLWGPAGLERLASGVRQSPDQWAAEERALAASLLASADALGKLDAR